MNVSILGAPGCVGVNLIQSLLEKEDVIITGSYRSEKEIPGDIKHRRLLWKNVDLFSQESAENFMRDTDALIYLIHSLGVKDFEKLDIKLANAAGAAAKKMGVKKIIYLGGIVPENEDASPHLTSRMKTGQALASHEIPVAEVRASILLETCSASFQIIYYLSKKLPVMITPKWLNSYCSPIGLKDAVSFISVLIDKNIQGHEIFEIGSDIIRYRDLLSLCGKSIRGFKNIIIPVPLFAIELSALWIELITGVKNTVAIALAEGLRTNTVPSKNRFKEVTGRDPSPVESVLKELSEKMKNL